MWPTLHCGDFVLIWSYKPRFKSDDLVVVRHPVAGLVIKRVGSLTACGSQLQLTSDNAEVASLATRGWVDRACVSGRVVMRIPRRKV